MKNFITELRTNNADQAMSFVKNGVMPDRVECGVDGYTVFVFDYDKIEKASKRKKRNSATSSYDRSKVASKKRGCITSGKTSVSPNVSGACKPVRCIETGEVYVSQIEAANKTGCRASGISLCCNKKAKMSGGFHWEFFEGVNSSTVTQVVSL